MKDLIVEKIYEITKIPYQKWFKKENPWPINRKDLLQFEQQTLGFHLGCFLLKHDFELQAQFEDHDVIHVLTQTSISVIDEIGMQFYLLGNGKRSPYLFLGVVLGMIFYANKWKLFLLQYSRGKQAHCFHQLNFFNLLHHNTLDVKESFAIR